MPRTGPVTRDTTTIPLGLAQIRVGDSVSNIANINPALVANDSLGAMASTGYTGETEYWDLESGFPLGLDATFPLRETNILECAFKEITPKNLALARGLNPLADIAATVNVVGSSTVGGGTAGSISVTDTAGPTTETFTVVFSDATNYDVYGVVSGHVGSSLISVLFAPDNSGEPYFSIPANFFDANWLADESFTFATTAFVAGSSAYDDPHAGSIGLGSVSAPEFIRVEAHYTFPNGTNTMTIIFPRTNITSSLNIDFQAEDSVAVAMTMKSMTASSDIVGGNAVWDNFGNGRIVFA